MTSGVREPGAAPALPAGALLDQHGAGVVVVIAPPGSGRPRCCPGLRRSAPRRLPGTSLVPEDRSATAFVAPRDAGSRGGDRSGPRRAAGRRGDSPARSRGRPRVACCWCSTTSTVRGPPRPGPTNCSGSGRRVRIALGTRRPLAAELRADGLGRTRRARPRGRVPLVGGRGALPAGVRRAAVPGGCGRADPSYRRLGGRAHALPPLDEAGSPRPSERAVADLGGRSRLRSYLTRTVLDELDRDRREFLLATCTLGTLTARSATSCSAGRQCGRPRGARVPPVLHHPVGGRAVLPLPPGAPDAAGGLLVEESGDPRGSRSARPSAVLLEDASSLRGAARLRAGRGLRVRGRMLQQSAAGVATDECVTVDADRDDPWLALVRARRLQRAGACSAAVAAYGERRGHARRPRLPPAVREERRWPAPGCPRRRSPTWPSPTSPRRARRAVGPVGDAPRASSGPAAERAVGRGRRAPARR